MKNSKFKVQSLRNRLCWLVLILPLIACTPAKQDSPTSASILPSATAKVSVESGTASVSGNKFTVKIYVENVSDIYGAGFVISYNANVATPTQNATITTSWALAQDGTGNMSYTLQDKVPVPGKFNVGMTRLQPSGVPVASKMLLCEIEFNRVATGSLNLTFDATSVSTGLVRTGNIDIGTVTWEHGVVTVP